MHQCLFNNAQALIFTEQNRTRTSITIPIFALIIYLILVPGLFREVTVHFSSSAKVNIWVENFYLLSKLFFRILENK